MQITTRDADIFVDDSVMRMYVAAPKPEGKYPGILLYSEIFQLTAPIRRSVERLAGHGFVVAAPEIYHRTERPGVVIPYDDIGRMWGNEDARKTPVAAFDADARATLNFLAAHPRVAPGALGTMGFCIGGHLAFRAALQPDVKAAVCCYPTGVHNGKLGLDPDAGTLRQLPQIKGEMLIVFGEVDPHVPGEGRTKIADALKAAGTKHTIKLVPGEHAFMRDEGPRYDSACADTVWAEAVALFQRVFAASRA
jgi:carboxymethylenebutenolidase